MGDLIRALAENPDGANAVATAANAVIALAALLVATVSIFVSWRALRHQVRHNKLSARPIPFLSLSNFQNRLRVRILNDGIGPLIVRRVAFSDGKRTEKDVIEWMPEPPPGIIWSLYTRRLENRSILPGTSVTLLELEGDVSNQSFAEFRDKCRRVLQKLSGTIEYTDVYGDDFAPYRRDMDFFEVK